MPDESTPHKNRPAARRERTAPPAWLVHEARTSLRATVVYASTLSDRIELACAWNPDLLDGIAADSLLHLTAVSEAFQDAARHTLWFIEPEFARSTQVMAALARDGAGEPPQDHGRSSPTKDGPR